MSHLPARRASRRLLIPIDRSIATSLQEQISRFIQGLIDDGTLQPGARLPSSRALADDLDVSRTTTQLAYDELQAEGYVEGRSRSGTYVATGFRQRAAPPIEIPLRTRQSGPSMSRRGAALAALPLAIHRIAGPPRAFRAGVPALDLFPNRLWSELEARHARRRAALDRDYGDPAGLPALRELIAEHVATTRATRCTADDVVIVSGAQNGIDVVCQLLLDPGDNAWVEDPGYPGARSALVAAAARPIAVPVDDGGLDLNAPATRGSKVSLIYTTPSHQFPTGIQMSLARRQALLACAARAGAWIVEDDYDGEFCYDQSLPSLHGLDSDGRVVHVGSFSQSLCPDLRLGYLVVPRALRAAAIRARQLGDHAPPLSVQATVATFIAEGHYERHLRRMRVAYRERLAAFVETTAQIGRDLFRLRPVPAGLHAVVDIARADARDVAAAAAAIGIETMPLETYAQSPSNVSAHALMLGFGALAPASIVAGLQHLARAIPTVHRDTITSP